MIVTCPQCAARYRLSDAVVARRGRLRCAACEHRWTLAQAPGAAQVLDSAPHSGPEPVPEPAIAVTAPLPAPRRPVTDADEEADFLAAQEQIRARWLDAAMPVAGAAPTPDTISADDDGAQADDDFAEPPAPESVVLRTAIAVIAGAALSIAAAGLWIGGRDLSGLPLIGPALAPPPLPADVAVTLTGTTMVLPSGRQLLEVTGTFANPGKQAVPVPPLIAILSGPDGEALRWSIATPRIMLPPGRQIGFSSTVAGFPESARTLRVVRGR